MKIVTHNGHFHSDELLAVAALLIKYPGAEIVRSRDEEAIKSADIVVDVGQIYDAAKFRFDHHQPGGAGERPNGSPYASFGLVWKEFGVEIAGGKDEAKIIEDKIVVPVDAGDNGLSIETEIFPGIRNYTLWDYFQSFSIDTVTLEDSERCFNEALVHARQLLEREIKAAKRVIVDWKEVQNIYNQSGNKKIIFLPKRLHWKRILIPTEAVFVVLPRPGGWSVQGVPPQVHSFEVKKSFPPSWGGLEYSSLASVSGVSDAFFCHKGRWIAGVHSKEGALKLAEIALNS